MNTYFPANSHTEAMQKSCKTAKKDMSEGMPSHKNSAFSAQSQPRSTTPIPGRSRREGMKFAY